MEAFESICSLESKVILLLCSGMGRPRDQDPRPLSPREYNHVSAWLEARNLSPQDLPGAAEKIPQDPVSGLDTGRLQALLGRQSRLDGWLSWLQQHSLWVTGRNDPGYPSRLRQRLGRLAPPLLHGGGESTLLDRGGLAVVGSRDAEKAKLAFSRLAAARCAAEGIQVVSGGARGVDRAAMLGALEVGGSAVGVLPGGLERAAGSAVWRDQLTAGRLALVTPFEPDSGFTVGNAMGRNRFIYLLSDWALVVDAAAGRGGSWAGAVQALKQRHVPVFVCLDEEASEGSRLLVEQGALPLGGADFPDGNITAWLNDQVESAVNTNTRQLRLC
jgi:predicted Rossmann fold nucleotide-binding protein DprA/Smf involved in DNA uptake